MRIPRHFVLAALVCLCARSTRAADAIELASCVQVPDGIAAWTPTATITHLEVGPSGFHIDFDKKDSWPDVIPPGWDGPIRWTVWLGAIVNGRCHLAAALNVWNRDDSYGGPVDQGVQYAKNLWYLDAGLAGYIPSPGDPIYLMVSAGAERGLVAFKVAERSQVVSFPLGIGSWSFTRPLPPAPPPVVVPPAPPIVQPPVVTPPIPDPLPSRDLLSAVQTELDARLEALRLQLQAVGDELSTLHKEVIAKWTQYVGPILKYGGAVLAGILAKWKLGS